MTQSHAFAPWHDPGWTIAAHPCTMTLCQRKPDWWFDLHPRSCFDAQKGWHRDYPAWLRNLQQPIFMQEDWPDIPMAIRFPKERILAEYRGYFTNHVAWMIALAMTEGVTHIGIYGCEYSHTVERGMQRGSLEYWLGMFEGHGGHVILPPTSRLLNKPAELYGYESHDPTTGKLIASYRPAPDKDEVPIKPLDVPPLTILDPAKNRPTHMVMPEQEPAWERSGWPQKVNA